MGAGACVSRVLRVGNERRTGLSLGYFCACE